MTHLVLDVVLLSFLCAGIGCAMAKFWQDTVYISSAYLPELISATAIPPFHSIGMLVGALVAGVLVDYFDVYYILANALMCLGLSVLLLGIVVCMPSTSYSVWVIQLACFVRGAAISCLHNVGYSIVKKLYAGTDYLTLMMSRFLSIVFFSATIAPFTLTYLVGVVGSISKHAFGVLCIALGIVHVFCALLVYTKSVANKNQVPILVMLHTHQQNMKLLLQDKAFVLYGLIAAICIGGFYNTINCYHQMIMHGSVMDLQYVQTCARVCTLFGTLCLPYFVCSSISLMRMALYTMCVLWCLNYVSYIMLFPVCYIGVLAFAQGLVHPIAKSSLLTLYHSKEKQVTDQPTKSVQSQSISGVGQSIVTVMNSGVEFLGSTCIHWLVYPFNVYAVCTVQALLVVVICNRISKLTC